MFHPLHASRHVLQRHQGGAYLECRPTLATDWTLTRDAAGRASAVLLLLCYGCSYQYVTTVAASDMYDGLQVRFTSCGSWH
jgi:hypothetical protein